MGIVVAHMVVVCGVIHKVLIIKQVGGGLASSKVTI